LHEKLPVASATEEVAEANASRPRSLGNANGVSELMQTTEQLPPVPVGMYAALKPLRHRGFLYGEALQAERNNVSREARQLLCETKQ